MNYFAPKWLVYIMIWLPRTTNNSTYFAQSIEIRGIEKRLYLQAEWKTNVDPDQLARKPADQDLHSGIFLAILGRGPRAFQIGKISAVNH